MRNAVLGVALAAVGCSSESDNRDRSNALPDGSAVVDAQADHVVGSDASADTDGTASTDAASSADGDADATASDAHAADARPDAKLVPDGTVEAAAPGPKGGRVVVRLTSAGQNTLWARYALGTQDWARIDGLELHPVGDRFCGTSIHDDPNAYAVELAPGVTFEFPWDGWSYVSRGPALGACWERVYADPGSYPAEVCVLTADVPLVPIAQVDAGGVTVCKPVALDLPASGETVVEVSFEDP